MVATNKWWGYEHINGSLQVKRFFSQEDIDEAECSPFVTRVIGIVDAADRDEAIRLLIAKGGGL